MAGQFPEIPKNQLAGLKQQRPTGYGAPLKRQSGTTFNPQELNFDRNNYRNPAI